MRNHAYCCVCGDSICDREYAFYIGVADAHSLYCTNCRREFLLSIRDRIDNEYGIKDGLGDVYYQYDDESKAFFDLEDFIDAEGERLADAYLNIVEFYDERPVWGYSWAY
jgi:hypothetical protein